MAMIKVKSVEEYIESHEEWKVILEKLRSIITETELEETIKWYMPSYCYKGKNIIGLGAFKNYAGLWFHQGSFLSDPYHVLINAQEGKTKGLRQWRFAKASEVTKKKVLPYVIEAIENCKNGLEIKVERKKSTIPSLLKEAFKNDTKLADCFKRFTSYKQREFCEYISEAKRETTKHSRLHKIIPMIKDGVGINDKYRKS